jgi:hypothetical protein
MIDDAKTRIDYTGEPDIEEKDGETLVYPGTIEATVVFQDTDFAGTIGVRFRDARPDWPVELRLSADVELGPEVGRLLAKRSTLYIEYAASCLEEEHQRAGFAFEGRSGDPEATAWREWTLDRLRVIGKGKRGLPDQWFRQIANEVRELEEAGERAIVKQIATRHHRRQERRFALDQPSEGTRLPLIQAWPLARQARQARQAWIVPPPRPSFAAYPRARTRSTKHAFSSQLVASRDCEFSRACALACRACRGNQCRHRSTLRGRERSEAPPPGLSRALP